MTFCRGGIPGIDPLAVLNGIVDGTLGSFEVAEIRDTPGHTTSATASAATWKPVDIGNGAQQLQVGTVLINVNSSAGNFVNGGSSARTTVLHELGHAIYLLYGHLGSGLLSSSYGIQPDVDPKNESKTAAMSQANQKEVNKHCR